MKVDRSESGFRSQLCHLVIGGARPFHLFDPLFGEPTSEILRRGVQVRCENGKEKENKTIVTFQGFKWFHSWDNQAEAAKDELKVRGSDANQT